MSFSERIERAVLAKKELFEHIASDCVNDDDAVLIIEDVLDTLVEVGNGVTDTMLHESADLLFAFRDKWLNKKIGRV